MTEKAPTEQVIRQMLAGVFDDATPESLQAAAESITRVGLHRAPTVADVDAFVSEHAQLLRSPTRRSRRAGVLAARLREAGGLVSEEAASAAGHVQAALERAAARAEARRADAARKAARRHEDLRRSSIDAETAMHRLRFELLMKAVDDPDLAAVLHVYDTDVSPARRRQFLFSDALYTQAMLAYRTGVLSWEELHGHLRRILQNPIFQEYWEATRSQRASLPDTSEESRIGRMADILIRDLQEADTEEWWVVGSPPEEHD